MNATIIDRILNALDEGLRIDGQLQATTEGQRLLIKLQGKKIASLINCVDAQAVAILILQGQVARLLDAAGESA